MAPFTTKNVWRASVHVHMIALLIQGHSLLASQNECMKNDLEMCMYDCSASEMQMFNCSEYTNTSYTPPVSHSFCCPGYYKITEPRRCQKCKDVEFMPRLNNCCGCILCKDCDALTTDTVKETCTREKNTVCWIETDPPPSPGLTCPIEGLLTTTGPPDKQPTGTKYSNCSDDDAEEVKSNSILATGFYVVLMCFIILLVIIFAFCLYVMRLGKPSDEVESPVDYREATWTEALTLLGQKLQRSVSCRRRGQPRGQPGCHPGGQPGGKPGYQHELAESGFNNRENDGQDEPVGDIPFLPVER